MKLVAIGIGGTGAACVEALVHMTAIGLFEEGIELVPVMLDPDRNHPRIDGTLQFLSAYATARIEGQSQDLIKGGLLGSRLTSDLAANAMRPAKHESLFDLFGLSNPHAFPLARMFYVQSEIGSPRSREFANGFYGRTNAGVCFFSDDEGKQHLLESLREHLLGADTKVVLFGSVFGGTGAAGLLHVSRTLRDDLAARNRKLEIAAVQIESYFHPDSSRLSGPQVFVNLPETFMRRTGATYEFMSRLAAGNNLPFDVLYPLGIRKATIFPPEWFKRDQQDNPHLFLEYVAALAVRDFVLNPPPSGGFTLRIRMTPGRAFEEPLSTLRHLLYVSLADYLMLRSFVIPLLEGVQGAQPLPGHPWIYDLREKSGMDTAGLLRHFRLTLSLLRVVLGHAGVLAMDWRYENFTGMSEEDRARCDEMSGKTRESFPTDFLPIGERLSLPSLVKGGNPTVLFDGYDRISADAMLPVRGLHRWIVGSIQVPGIQKASGSARRDYQLTQQEDAQERAGRPQLNLGSTGDDRFFAVENPVNALSRLAQAAWETQKGARGREECEFPSVWAPALVYAEKLYGQERNSDASYAHLGLLWVALMKWKSRAAPPIYPLRPEAMKMQTAFRDSLRGTCPLRNYNASVIQDGSVLALLGAPTSVPEGSPIAEEDLLGFFYPATIIVPIREMSNGTLRDLVELGRHACRRGFPNFLLSRLGASWPLTLEESEVPEADRYGHLFINFLKAFPSAIAEADPVSPDEAYARPYLPGAAPWIRALYE